MSPDGSVAEKAPRRRRKDDRPGEVLNAALEVFLERGFTNARMDEIATRAGVAKGTVYLYFPSKEDIFKALVRKAADTQIDQMERNAAAFPGPASVLVRMILGRAKEILRDPKLIALPRLVLTEAPTFPEVVAFYRIHLVERMLRLIASIHRRGVEAGEFREADSDAVARLIAAPVLMSALWRTVLDPEATNTLSSDTVIDTHVEIMMRGLKADGPGQ